MKVLLASTNRSRNMVPTIPLGLSFLAAALDRRRWEVGAWDAMFEEDWEASLRERLAVFRPDVIGLSVRNVDDQEIRRPAFLLEESRRMAEICREASGAVLVAGGPAFSMFAAEAFDFLGVDYGVLGEGEKIFPRLLERLEAGEAPDDLPGLVRRDADGRIVLNPPELLPSLDHLAAPDRSLFDIERYYGATGTAGRPNSVTVQTKRGCSFGCIYCDTPLREGPAPRLRPPGAVADELEGLARRGWRRIQFVDAVFTNPPAHAAALSEEILRRNLGIQWAATINPACADPDLLRLMARAGCNLFTVGNESCSDRVLENLGKGYGREAVERTFRLLEAEGLRYVAFLLLGGPGEDRASVQESVAVMERFRPSQVSVTVGLRIYPGCEIERIARAEGVLAPGEGLLAPRFYLAEPLQGWIWDYLEAAAARNPGWLL